MVDDFSAKLRHVLMVANLSRTRLSKLVGVDKSVASRWVSGATQPSESNLDALTRALGEFLPELKLSDWSRALPEFEGRVGVASGHSGPAWGEPTRSQKPSIAVLPFTNMSDDPTQEFFSDGIAEDILTALSKLRWLHVIARNSTFVYKGKAVDVREVSSDFGVRYVLEGSVRRSVQRLRITAQLIDATTGAHLWAERYDRDLTDMFSVQDEIVGAVVTAISPTIVDAERQRAFHKPTQSLDAWEAYQRGLWHHSKRDAAESNQARQLFRQAVDLDPNFALGYLGLCLTHITDAVVFFRANYDEALREAEAMARKAIALDEGNVSARLNLGYVYRLQGHLNEALREAEYVLAIEPASAEALGLKGVTLVFKGEPETARAALHAALKFGPRDPRRPVWRTHLAASHYIEGEYEQAAQAAKVAVQEYPAYPNAACWLAASLGQIGATSQAAAALQRAFQLANDREPFPTKPPPFFAPADHARFIEGLCLAGWKS